MGTTQHDIIDSFGTEGIFMVTASASSSTVPPKPSKGSKDSDKDKQGKWKATDDEFKNNQTQGGNTIGKKARQEAREARPRAHQHRQDKNRGPQEAIATPPGTPVLQVRSDGRTNYGRTMGGEGSLDPNSA